LFIWPAIHFPVRENGANNRDATSSRCYLPEMPDYLARPDGLRLAYNHRPGRGPTIVFLPGYMSDMEGTKALALDSWAEGEGRAFLRFDYSGCGASEGRFEEATLAIWRNDILHLIDSLTEGPLLLVGSSMGGWLMLLVALARPERIAGLIGIAAAPDFTDWGFTDDERQILIKDGILREPSAYSNEPYLTTRELWLSGQANLLLAKEIPLDCPVRLLHGQRDEDVPVSISFRLGRALRSADVQTILVKDGDHRLSRDEDLALLIATAGQLLERL
jgi:pimeloyl-ACP methyl ester carboxylesterase